MLQPLSGCHTHCIFTFRGIWGGEGKLPKDFPLSYVALVTQPRRKTTLIPDLLGHHNPTDGTD